MSIPESSVRAALIQRKLGFKIEDLGNLFGKP